MSDTPRPNGRPKTVALIGAPVEDGASVPGCLMGPDGLRTAGLSAQLRGLGLDVRDLGNLCRDVAAASGDPPAGVHRWHAVAGWAAAISAAVRDTLAAGDLPLVLGGDHSLSIGSVNGAALQARDAGRALSVLWLDAHADVNTPATTGSGNLHGMPVAAFTGEPGLDGLFAAGPRASVPPSHVHLFGIRSVDPGERVLLRERGIDVVDMRVIDENGVVAPLKRILDTVAARGGMLHVSFDVDFLDPAVAPGVGTSVPGGVTFREAHLVMEMLHDSDLVTSVDVVELNPFLDERGRTALLMVDLVASLFGRRVFDRPTQAAQGRWNG